MLLSLNDIGMTKREADALERFRDAADESEVEGVA